MAKGEQVMNAESVLEDMTSESDGNQDRRRRHSKRVTSRELDAAEAQAVEGEIARPATIAPIKDPTQNTEDAAVVDPTTLLGWRRRRKMAQVFYRLTEVLIGASLSLTALTLLAAVLQDRDLGLRLGLGALGAAVVALVLAGRVTLIGRLRGYALAALVLAGVAIVAALVLPQFHGDDTASPQQFGRVERR